MLRCLTGDEAWPDTCTPCLKQLGENILNTLSRLPLCPKCQRPTEPSTGDFRCKCQDTDQ